MNEYSPHIFGIHDYSDEWANMVKQAGKSAWAVHTEAVGCDPNDRSGKVYPEGVTNIVRLNNGYGTTGSIPLPHRYADFAQRCANFVYASRNVDFVVCANEIALRWEWPENQPITLANYMQCYLQVYSAIKSIAPNVLVAPQGVAPWNAEVPDCPDWVQQLTRQLTMAGKHVDWICLHAYTRGYGLDSFATGAKMGAPYSHCHSGWEALFDFMGAIPAMHRTLPVVITEANGDGSWPGHNSGWVQKFYAELDKWNQGFGHQKILAGCLFRWAKHDEKWDISRHGGSVEDFRQALSHDYRHGYTLGAIPTGLCVNADVGLNLRKEPNAQAEILTVIPNGERVVLVDTVVPWLQVSYKGQTGWVHGDYVGVC